MKLICETIEDVEFITEEDESGKKNTFIQGIFMQGNIKNRNGRLYPTEILQREVERYINENVNQGRAYGELGHPEGPAINLERVSHIIVELKQDGNNFIGKAKITDTPMGNIVKNLIGEGANLGVSSRGMGTLKSKRGIMEVQGDFRLATAADIVAEPSAPDAFVKGIMEGVDWMFDIASGSWVASNVMDEIEDTVRHTNNLSEEHKFFLFEKFVRSL